MCHDILLLTYRRIVLSLAGETDVDLSKKMDERAVRFSFMVVFKGDYPIFLYSPIVLSVKL